MANKGQFNRENQPYAEIVLNTLASLVRELKSAFLYAIFRNVLPNEVQM